MNNHFITCGKISRRHLRRRSGVFIVSFARFHTFFWCFLCKFEQVYVGCAPPQSQQKRIQSNDHGHCSSAFIVECSSVFIVKFYQVFFHKIIDLNFMVLETLPGERNITLRLYSWFTIPVNSTGSPLNFVRIHLQIDKSVRSSAHCTSQGEF